MSWISSLVSLSLSSKSSESRTEELYGLPLENCFAESFWMGFDFVVLLLAVQILILESDVSMAVRDVEG